MEYLSLSIIILGYYIGCYFDFNKIKQLTEHSHKKKREKFKRKEKKRTLKTPIV